MHEAPLPDVAPDLAEKADLERFGYVVRTVVSGTQAIERVAGEQIDLILMDIDLGPSAMDGTETTRQILADHDIPIVFLSSHTEPEYIVRICGEGNRCNGVGRVHQDGVQAVRPETGAG